MRIADCDINKGDRCFIAIDDNSIAPVWFVNKMAAQGIFWRCATYSVKALSDAKKGNKVKYTPIDDEDKRRTQE